jgi:hypothetical protein
MPDFPQILSVSQGPFVRKLIQAARRAGITFDSSWEDTSAFVKLVNDGWGQDPGAGAGWFPPRIFEGVPRLHLSRTLTILAITSYLTEARGILPKPLVEGGMSLQECWCGALPAPGLNEQVHPVLREVLYVHSPAPISSGVARAVVDTYGLQPIRPEAGISVVYALAREEGEIQGYSLPLLELDGKLLPVVQEQAFTPFVADSYFLERPNPSRTSRHLERYYDLFDISETQDRAWNRAVVGLLHRLFGPGVLLD